jgi:alanyl-tRNA synthetase
VVSEEKRFDTARNHSATHLLHHALRHVLGKHVEQKGSLVNSEYLRFDFSHYQKMTEDELAEVERIVNSEIAAGIEKDEKRAVPMEEAKKMGAMALFGEKYGDSVRVIRFGNSVELCGGTHVDTTSRIGLFKIVSEGSIASGIRRIEAITGEKALNYFREKESLLRQIEEMLGRPQDVLRSLTTLIDEKGTLQKLVEKYSREAAGSFKQTLLGQMNDLGGYKVIAARADSRIDNAAAIKDIAYQLRNEAEDLVVILGAVLQEKPHLAIMVSDSLVAGKKLHAGEIVRTAAKEFDGGGGGQPFFATAGGKDAGKLDLAIAKALELVKTAAAT